MVLEGLVCDEVRSYLLKRNEPGMGEVYDRIVILDVAGRGTGCLFYEIRDFVNGKEPNFRVRAYSHRRME